MTVNRESKQHPRAPVQVASFIYDPEITETEPPDHVTAIPEGPQTGSIRFLLNAERFLERGLYAGMVLMGIGLATIMFVQVLLRYVFALPFVGIEELALLMGAWFYFLGLAYVTRNGEHIHGGIVTLLIKSPTKIQSIRLLMTLVSIAACLVFGYYAGKYAFFEIERGRASSYMRWPKGLWSASMIIGFAGTIIYLALQAINQTIDLKTRLSFEKKG
ncbi:TRAP transporter small permease [Pseudovibrio ascidiaceicola]|uniref:TRAP transporter small permease n=1 Tax=Pseudovibrio ascidiaceicola TaxID=285279 RepID=UPI000D69CDB0|nr:TRAP transporter small permease [Pseudovibrio ascidiaceicola]